LKKEIKKAKFFYSNELNQSKFNIIEEKAIKINDFKNKISNEIYNNLLFFLDKSKFDVIKYFNCQIDNLNGQDIQNVISDVWVSYSNMFEDIKQELTFKQKSKYKSKFKSTKLSMVLTFLSKYGYEGISQSIKIPISDKKDNKKAIFYQEIKDYCEKYGEYRLLNLAISKRIRILKKKSKLIKYDKLSFRTITRINSNIFDFNDNFNSIFNGFINLGGYDGYKKLSIPTKFNKEYHGNKSNYHRDLNSKQNSQSYQVKIIDSKKKLIRITYLIDDYVEIFDDNTNYLGADVNVKRNLFSTELGDIDFDRKMINDYVKFLNKIDHKKSKTLNKKRSRSYMKWRLKIKNQIKEKMNNLIKLAKLNGRNHLVLEDLSLLGKAHSKSEEFGINYGRLFRLLGLSSIKNELENMCRNQNISISIVQPEYSSQTCHPCGYISKENRKTQEEFICVSCGHSDDADRNSSKNIKYRITSNVLRDLLLDKNEFNEWRPKSYLKREFIKDSISNSYSSEMIEP